MLGELSTLASVYHKPPESFVGKGRFGADEIQRAAIQEQRQNAAENPIAASVAAVASANGAAQNNVENLLDIDFDGAAPASQEPSSNAGGASSSSMADMMGLFDAPPAASSSSPAAGGASGGMADLMNGFAGLDFGASTSSQPLPAAMQLAQQSGSQPAKPPAQQNDSEDLLGLL